MCVCARAKGGGGETYICVHAPLSRHTAMKANCQEETSEVKDFNGVGLDPNHSHFILVENKAYEKKKGFGLVFLCVRERARAHAHGIRMCACQSNDLQNISDTFGEVMPGNLLFHSLNLQPIPRTSTPYLLA